MSKAKLVKDCALRIEGKSVKKYVLCGYCNKQINVKDFGGIINGKFFHKDCLIMNKLLSVEGGD